MSMRRWNEALAAAESNGVPSENLDAVAQLEGVGQTIRRHLPTGGELRCELGDPFSYLIRP